MALEIKQVYEGMMIALPPPIWEVFADMNATTLAKALKEIAAHVDLEMYRKSPRGPKKLPPKKTAYEHGGHVSTHKLITGEKN